MSKNKKTWRYRVITLKCLLLYTSITTIEIEKIITNNTKPSNIFNVYYKLSCTTEYNRKQNNFLIYNNKLTKNY